MKEVYKYIAKRNVNFIFYKGDICVQCFDKDNFIYNETSDFVIDLAFIESHGGWKKYFKRNKEKIDAKETKYYIIRKCQLENEKLQLEEEYKRLSLLLENTEKRLREINQLIF